MAKTEKRTQVYLTTAQHRAATARARHDGTSLAGVVREALNQYLAGGAGPRVDWQHDPVVALIGALPLPPRPAGVSLSDYIDQVVYEEEPHEWSSSTAPPSSQPSTATMPRTKRQTKRGDESSRPVNRSSRRNSS